MDADSLRSRFRVLVPIYLGPIHILACAWWAVGTWSLPNFWSPAFHAGAPGVPASVTIASWSGHSVVQAFNATAYAEQLAQHWVGLFPGTPGSHVVNHSKRTRKYASGGGFQSAMRLLHAHARMSSCKGVL